MKDNFVLVIQKSKLNRVLVKLVDKKKDLTSEIQAVKHQHKGIHYWCYRIRTAFDQKTFNYLLLTFSFNLFKAQRLI